MSRFRLLLSDGHYSNSFSMLATQLNNLIHDNQLAQYTIIKVNRVSHDSAVLSTTHC